MADTEIKDWLDYQHDVMGRDETEYSRNTPILCPLTIKMTSNATFQMDRMTVPFVDSLKDNIFASLPLAKKAAVNDVLLDYIDFFGDQDQDNAAIPPGPLDMQKVKRPVIYLIYLENDNWVFSGHKQISAVNDDPHLPEIRQLSAFDGNSGILVYRTHPIKRLKFDYYVTVYEEDGKSTDIIIDPPDDDPRSGSGGGTGNQSGD